MKKLLVIAAVVGSLIAGSASPAHAANATRASKFNIGDCPVFTVQASIQEPRLVTTQPLNLGFGAEIGNHKQTPTPKCATNHELKVAEYLYLLPVGTGRTLVATSNSTGFCFDCNEVLDYNSVVAPPGYYQVVADFFVDRVLVTSIATKKFLYDGFSITDFEPFA